MGDELTGLTAEQAAKRMGTTVSAVTQMIFKNTVPSEKIGGRRYIEESVVDAIIDLRSEFGRVWSKHAPWNGGDGGSGGGRPAKTHSKKESAVDLIQTLSQRLIERAKVLRKQSKHQEACDLYELVIDHVDWSQMEV